jgi:alkylation response protein AidB-like acyl-CoA dehydrogenase
MVVTMHYAATAALATAGVKDPLTDIAAARDLSTLAFSESGSRSHFWAPLGTATEADGGARVRLDASKSWVTSAGHADSYVWSSKPLSADGPMTLWLMPGGADGLTVAGAFDGLGLRGNASAPMTATGVLVPRGAMIGADGAGLDLAMAAVLPVFLLCSAAMSAGLLRRLAEETAAHLQRTQLLHIGHSLAQQAQPRAQLARLRIEADRTWGLIEETLGAVESGRADAQILVLEVKAAAAEAAGSLEPAAIGRGWRAVHDLRRQMDEGRRRRLAYIGFPDDEAAELSALHTRNFM